MDIIGSVGFTELSGATGERLGVEFVEACGVIGHGQGRFSYREM